jgi:hypothetical protein
MSGGRTIVAPMQNDNVIREAIEAQLISAVELGFDTEEALAETAGLLAEAEAAFVRLSHPRFSLPPPPRR